MRWNYPRVIRPSSASFLLHGVGPLSSLLVESRKKKSTRWTGWSTQGSWNYPMQTSAEYNDTYLSRNQVRMLVWIEIAKPKAQTFWYGRYPSEEKNTLIPVLVRTYSYFIFISSNAAVVLKIEINTYLHITTKVAVRCSNKETSATCIL